MLNVLIRRVLIAIPVLIIVASLTFFFIRLAPGGPFDADKVVSPQVMKNLNAAYNLDAPLHQQYFDYMSGVVVGDFGPSFRYPGRSVSEMIYTGLPITFELAFYALMIAVALGIFSGVLAALKRNTFLDYFPMAIAMLGICVPTFLMGPILVLVFGINFEVLPVSGWDTLAGDKLLPSITLGFAYAAYIARLSRGGMLEVLGQDFIRTARAKGLSEFSIVTRHAMQGGLLPVVSFMGPAIAGLLGGSFVVETIFQIPGLGRLVLGAISERNYPLLQSSILVMTAAFVLVNFFVDILYSIIDPRVSKND